MNFYPVLTDDGSISLFNSLFNDIYHSKIGAYTEALEKYVNPSGIIEFCKINNCVNILDICFGLGYNSLIAADKILEANNKCIINITAIEIDPYVLAYSYYISIPLHKIPVLKHYRRALLSNKSVRSIITAFANDVKYNFKIRHKYVRYLNKKYFTGIYKVVKSKNNTNLHNIYYRSVSERNRKTSKIQYNANNVNFSIYIQDARKAVNDLKTPYDFVFHDPFAPSKLPVLWSVELFELIHTKLKPNGLLLTYSSAASVRSGLIEAGFYIGKTEPVGRKSSGTVACKNKCLSISKLSLSEVEILNTKSGIAYHDPELSFNNDQMVQYRNALINHSNKITASQYFKHKDKGLS